MKPQHEIRPLSVYGRIEHEKREHECDGCEKVFTQSELKPVVALSLSESKRIKTQLGVTGVCPSCGAFTFKQKKAS